MKRTSSALFVIRYNAAYIDLAKQFAAGYREDGLRTRLVYRGPRPLVRCWRSGKMITPAYSLKKNAVAVDLYVYKK